MNRAVKEIDNPDGIFHVEGEWQAKSSYGLKPKVDNIIQPRTKLSNSCDSVLVSISSRKISGIPRNFLGET